MPAAIQVCLASAPTIAELGRLDAVAREARKRIPLGVLSLAGVLERMGRRPAVVDLDALYAAWRRARRGSGGFARHAGGHLARLGAEIYGLSTICSSYPLTLRIASALREARPGCRIVLGGPQATAVAEETLAAFPAVDAVARGEGEAVLPALVEAIASSRDLCAVPGVSARSGDAVASAPDAPPIENLDSMPLPAYHLHLGLERGRTLPLEVGRGCPFSCSFCSTSRFFGRRFRMRAPSRIVEDMLTLRRDWGTRSFDLVHDNFTVERGRVVAFCDALLQARARFTWACSARADTLDDDLLDLMRRAGCSGLFLGVESGSPAVQRAMCKCLDLAAARDRLRHLVRRRMTSTVSFIAGFPEERPEDLRETVSLFVESMRTRFLEPQMGLLSPLAGTPLQRRHRGELVLDGSFSDMVFQGVEQDRADRELIERHPDLFSSFYGVPTRWLDRAEVRELCSFLTQARPDLRWLVVAAARVTGDGIEAFRRFRAWRSARGREGAIRRPALRRELIRFVRDHLARLHPRCAPALRALARTCARLPREAVRLRPAGPSGGRPVRAGNVRLIRIECDGRALLRCLQRGGDLARVLRRRSALVARRIGGELQILHLGGEAADLLALCDGSRDALAVARAFGRLHPEVGGVPGSIAASFGLALFRRRGLLAPTGPAPARPASPGAPSSPRATGGLRRPPSSAGAGGRGGPSPRRGARAARASEP